jgi:hypothetical protein
MKSATVSEIKKELNTRSQKELVELCLHLSKFKKENKELLTYLLYEAGDEVSYIESIKVEIDEQFEEINTSSFYFIKKSVRKILRATKKYIRYSKQKETQVALLLYFCLKLKAFRPSIAKNVQLRNLYYRELQGIEKTLSTLHEDLQFDYQLEFDELTKF